MIQVSIITPDSVVFEGEVDAITLPTADGEITVMGGHVPLMGVLVPGTAIMHRGKEEEYFAVSRGVLEVDGKSIRVLADTADRAEALEEAAVTAAKERAEKLVAERRSD